MHVITDSLTDLQTPITPKAKSARLDDESESEFLSLLHRLKHVFKIAGINVLACYREFDHLSHGKVTASQVGLIMCCVMRCRCMLSI